MLIELQEINIRIMFSCLLQYCLMLDCKLIKFGIQMTLIWRNSIYIWFGIDIIIWCTCYSYQNNFNTHVWLYYIIFCSMIYRTVNRDNKNSFKASYRNDSKIHNTSIKLFAWYKIQRNRLNGEFVVQST